MLSYLPPYYNLNGLHGNIYVYFEQQNELMRLNYVERNKRCSGICLCHLCGTWSNPFYCNSRHEICWQYSFYSKSMILGLPAGPVQLNLF